MKNFLVLISLFSAVAVFADGNAFPPCPSIPVIAHRGFSGRQPENTLAAFRAAIEIGASGAECDTRRASDGTIYIMHDDNFKRTTGHDIPAGTIPYTEIAEFDAGNGEKIPTLKEYLNLLKGTGTHPVIEIKEDGFEAQVIEAIRDTKLENSAVVIDFSAARVKTIREAAPEICVAWLCSFDDEIPEEEIIEKIIDTLNDCHTNIVDMHFKRTTATLVKRLHDAGIQVWCWTVNHPDTIRRLVDMGVDSITTDYPDRALDVLGE
ncbi:MAG: glycerophosphodiester phosphodiesterase [Thermoguttaceae bacterium]|jgi:glycerophosphoryl diester phosphodiesterase